MALLRALGRARGGTSLREAATALGIPLPTAHRLVARLVDHGLLARTGRGQYGTGLTVFRLVEGRDEREVVAAIARPVLRRVARATRRTAHLGAFNGEMVTYLVREPPPRGTVFTREAMQLEAYCSAVGKMLLALATDRERDAYLATGGFIALTKRTIIDAELLRDHLRLAAAQGFAHDDEEVEEGLFCLAVPVDLPDSSGQLALSLAGTAWRDDEHDALLAAARGAAAEIAARLTAGTCRIAR